MEAQRTASTNPFNETEWPNQSPEWNPIEKFLHSWKIMFSVQSDWKSSHLENKK